MNKPPPVLPDLDDGILDPDPIKQFSEWYRFAVHQGVKLPDAMSLATATKDGRPSVRIVLLKRVDERGFEFYSNYESRKGRELSENPRAALAFHWAELERSVRVEGSVTKLTPEESDSYFATRPREGQLSSLTSSQSRVVENRAQLDQRYEELRQKYEGRKIPRPQHWGGYRLKPDAIEFWQQRFARLNDRILYTLGSDGRWSVCRLSP